MCQAYSPGCGKFPPPVMAVVEIVWCGSRNGRLEISPLPSPQFSCNGMYLGCFKAFS